MAERLSEAGFDLVIPCVKDTRGYLAYPSEVGKMDPRLEGDPELSALDLDGKPLGWACPRRDESGATNLSFTGR